MNTTALAIIQPEELETMQRTAKMLAASNYFDAKGDGVQAIAMMATKILAGREMGFGPFASVNGVHIIQGRPSIGANLMASAVKASGRYDYRVRELTSEVCKIEFFQRAGEKWESIGVSEFTKADATKAGTKNMDKFPKNMLFARAMSNGVRFYTPDIFSGNAVYVPEELGAEVDGDGNVVSATYTVTPQEAHSEAQPQHRVVDTTTGEIAPPQPTTQDTADNPFNDASPVDAQVKYAVLSSSQLQRLNILGVELYGKDEWETQRPILVNAVSKGAVKSCKELSPTEATKLINGIEKKLKEVEALKAAQQVEQVAA